MYLSVHVFPQALFIPFYSVFLFSPDCIISNHLSSSSLNIYSARWSLLLKLSVTFHIQVFVFLSSKMLLFFLMFSLFVSFCSSTVFLILLKCSPVCSLVALCVSLEQFILNSLSGNYGS